MSKRENSTAGEMITIILLSGVLLEIVLMFFAKRRLYTSIGLGIGIVLAVYMLVYMAHILRSGLGVEAKAAKNYVLRHSVIRYISVVFVFGFVIFAHVGNPLACFLGMMTLKAAAYLQPVFHRLKEKNKRQ